MNFFFQKIKRDFEGFGEMILLQEVVSSQGEKTTGVKTGDRILVPDLLLTSW